MVESSPLFPNTKCNSYEGEMVHFYYIMVELSTLNPRTNIPSEKEMQL